jgi:hypothetical protein
MFKDEKDETKPWYGVSKLRVHTLDLSKPPDFASAVNPESLRNPQPTRPYYSPDHYRAHPNPVGAHQMALEEGGPQSNP